MKTFTLRASEALAGQLSSAQVRSWMEEFILHPYPLPRDPGSGYGRVSLTLPESAVSAIVAHSRCTVSSALRRIAVERLGTTRQTEADVSRMIAPADRSSESGSQDSSFQGAAVAEMLAQFLVLVLFVGVLVYFTFRRRKGLKPA